MDSTKFDGLTKALATPTSRRTALRRIGGAITGAILASWPFGHTLASNSACAHFCNAVFGADTPAAKQCISDAAHGKGLCHQCGSATPSSICCSRNSSGYCSSYSGAHCPCNATQCQKCDATAGTCVSSCDTCSTCQSGTCASSCASGQVCQNGTCVTPCSANGGTCNGDSDCCSDTGSSRGRAAATTRPAAARAGAGAGRQGTQSAATAKGHSSTAVPTRGAVILAKDVPSRPPAAGAA